MGENKKAFNPTICFTFFGNWVEAIERCEKVSEHAAYRLFKAIAYYSMYDEVPNFEDDPLLSVSWAILEREIDISLSRRIRNFADDEANEKYQAIVKAKIANPSAHVREIAAISGTDKSMVSRVLRKYDKEINEAIRDNAVDDSADSADSDTYTVGDTVNVSGSAIVNIDDSDTMRQDSETEDINTVQNGNFTDEDMSDEKYDLLMSEYEIEAGTMDDDLPF